MKPTIVILIGVVAFLALSLSSADLSKRKRDKPYDPSIARSPETCIPVTVSFVGEDWMDADELRHKAKQTLATKGYKLDSAYECRINVELAGEGAGCRVTFGKGLGHTNYIVSFNAKGEAGKVETQLVIEGHSFPR